MGINTKSDVKKQRSVYANDEVWNKLKSKAHQFYEGKGALEKYLEDIANNHVLIIKSARVQINLEMLPK